MADELIWRDREQVVEQFPCTCIDGRTPGPRFSAAGGSFGIALGLLGQIEQQQAAPLSAAQVSQALQLFAREVAPLYLHSDSQALSRLLRSMKLPAETPLTAADTQSILQRLGETQQVQFVALASESQHQGCGHIGLILQHPAEYQISPSLSRHALQAFFRLWLAGEPRVLFDVLLGEHQETGVTLLESPDDEQAEPTAGLTPLLSAEQGSRFFCHRPLKQTLISRYLSALRSAFPDWPLPDDAIAARQQLDQRAELTLSRLAPQLPVSTLQPSALSAQAAQTAQSASAVN